jgi:hypothetical protein
MVENRERNLSTSGGRRERVQPEPRCGCQKRPAEKEEKKTGKEPVF